MPQKKVRIDTHMEVRTGGIFRSRRSVRVTLAGVPANATVDEAGRILDGPKPEANVEEHLLEHLARPAAELLGKFPERPGLPVPSVRFDFGSAADKAEAIEGNAAPPDAPARFPIEEPRWSLDAVILPDATGRQLAAALAHVCHHDLIFERWNLQSISKSNSAALSLNFHGPSGTGKSLCAEAVAASLGLGLLRVDYAELESKFVGQMNKNIQAVFAQARAHPCVVFFDEADSVLGKRLSQVTQAADHGVNMARSVLLTELDRYRGAVVFATNLPQNYDSAFARRILHSIRFDLPDQATRTRLFQIHLPAELPLDKEVSAERLAEATEGFSGADICNAVVLAATQAATQEKDDSTKTVALRHFLAAIEQIRAARAAITGESRSEPGATAEGWMDGRLQKSMNGAGQRHHPHDPR